jgi:flagellar biosynthetic protein FliP
MAKRTPAWRRVAQGAVVAGATWGAWPAVAWAQTPGAALSRSLSPQALATLLQDPALELTLAVGLLVLLPGMLLLMTSFTRIVVVLSLARTAIGTPDVPSNQVVIALALILTLFTMAPTLSRVNQVAVEPYLSGRLNPVAAADRATGPIRQFMADGTEMQDLDILVNATGQAPPKSLAQVPILTLVPAFAVSQLTLAFEMGFLLYLPFMLIDFLVASVLMALGMMMLPPTVVSLPFKLLLFVLVNGWGLLVGSLVATAH